jgi:UDP-N-acetylmuramyl pentapeptide synthase
MIEDYLELGAWPSNNNKADLANLNNIEGRFVKSIKAQKNVITIMYGYDANPAIFHEKITFTATETNGNFSWTCESAGKIPEKYLPRACR